MGFRWTKVTNAAADRLSAVAFASVRASSRLLETPRAFVRRAPLRRACLVCLLQTRFQPFKIEVLRIDRRSGLLTPGIIDTAVIEGIESCFIDQLHNDR